MAETPKQPQDDRVEPVPSPADKRPYEPPQVTERGDIDEITRNVGSQPTDLLRGGSRLL